MHDLKHESVGLADLSDLVVPGHQLVAVQQHFLPDLLLSSVPPISVN